MLRSYEVDLLSSLAVLAADDDNSKVIARSPILDAVLEVVDKSKSHLLSSIVRHELNVNLLYVCNGGAKSSSGTDCA